MKTFASKVNDYESNKKCLCTGIPLNIQCEIHMEW